MATVTNVCCILARHFLFARLRYVILTLLSIAVLMLFFLNKQLTLTTSSPPRSHFKVQMSKALSHKYTAQLPVEHEHTNLSTWAAPPRNESLLGVRTAKLASDVQKIHDFAIKVLGHTEWPDQCKGPHGIPQARPVPELDLTRYGPFPFLPHYRNPCWQEEGSDQLLCLPYFYLAGFPKCGTTDMYRRITLHPDVQKAAKEPHWITRRRFEGVSNFANYTVKYGRLLQLNGGNHSIVGDGSASTFWDNKRWYLLPGNENCSEPRVITADYIRHLNPDVKIIVILRNPVNRLYSDYMYFGGPARSPEGFHDRVLEKLANFSDCIANKSVRNCAYNFSLNSMLRLPIGLYSVFMEDWLLRVPRDQILVVRVEDVFGDIPGVMRKVFKFLNLADVDNATMESIQNLEQQNVGKQKSTSGPMLEKTKRLLESFYRPYNQRLAAILDNKKFLWQ